MNGVSRSVSCERSPPHHAPGAEAVPRPSILFVDPDAELYVPSLRRRFEVSAVSSEGQAIRALRAFQPSLVVTEFALPEGDGVSVCRQAKTLAGIPPLVLATTSVVERVPEALIAGCDGVLMKPFAPNLLFTRIGRLLQPRETLREQAVRHRATAADLSDQSPRAPGGTNIVWHDMRCPSCTRGGVVSFDAVSRGRMWYACLPCRKVWVGPSRQG